MTIDNVIDFHGERAHRLSVTCRACTICYDDRTDGGEEEYIQGEGWRWLCDRCVAEVDALDPHDSRPVA